MKTKGIQMSTRRQRGFSLLEIMISLAILSIVLGVVVASISSMQSRNSVEVNKVDLTQSAREFMDQIVNDIHQSGYPGLNMFDPATLTSPQSPTDCTKDNNIACGLISVSSTAIQFEGDVDGTGVSEVYIELSSGACPCTMKRGTVLKSVGGTPAFYTQVDNVMNSSVFTAYLADGSPVTLPAGAGGLNGITAIGVSLYVQSAEPDPQTGQYPTVTMVATSKINNIQSY